MGLERAKERPSADGSGDEAYDDHISTLYNHA